MIRASIQSLIAIPVLMSITIVAWINLTAFPPLSILASDISGLSSFMGQTIFSGNACLS